jgi:hypothetical protein
MDGLLVLWENIMAANGMVGTNSACATDLVTINEVSFGFSVEMIAKKKPARCDTSRSLDVRYQLLKPTQSQIATQCSEFQQCELATHFGCAYFRH